MRRGPGELVDAALHRFDALPSTMDLLHELAEAGAPAGTAVVAAEQTAGRGSRGRTWHSPPGGLWLSVLLRPSRQGTELLSLRAGLAIADGLEAAFPALGVRLKWPNDLLWRDRKFGGVLCEARWSGEEPSWTVMGIGLNVLNPVPEELAPTACTLAEAIPHQTPETILALILPRLREIDGSTRELGPVELAELERRDWLRGRRLSAPVAGSAAGIGAGGALLVRAADGRLTEVRAGTVALADLDGRR